MHGQTGRCTVLAKQWGKRITPDGQFHSGLLDRHQAIFYLPFNRIFRKPFVNGKELTSTYRVYDQCKRTFRPGLAVAFLQNQYNFFDSKCLFTCCSWVTILSQFSLPIPPIAVPLLISTEKPAAWNKVMRWRKSSVIGYSGLTCIKPSRCEAVIITFDFSLWSCSCPVSIK